MIKRKLEHIITENIDKGKVIIILGARQVGKTTLIKEIAGKWNFKYLLRNGDEPDTRELFTNVTSTELKAAIADNELLIIDEAQRITNIGLTLKLIIDNLEGKKVIATGSSSLDLANEINEPLTGRKIELMLFPLSFAEMVDEHGLIEEKRLLEHRLVYGYYPEVVKNPGNEKEILRDISDSYLYKDLFAYEKIKKPSLLEKLLQALSFQVGNEVSYNELSNLVGADKETVEKYIDLLEKAYVIFRLQSFRRNLRNEIKKSRKIYFLDNGIRNSIIKNFSPAKLRNDIGSLWENFLISERMKTNHYKQRWVNKYFWRTHAKQEIDYIEEIDSVLYAFEFKWNPKAKVKIPKTFQKTYPNSQFEIISKDNFVEFFV
ncbi:ATP-binding protein [Bacteroidota bacterium]